MSLRAEPLQEVPEETARIARAAFPKGNAYMRLRDELGILYEDTDFVALFPVVGQPAETPWRLALVMVMQFMENLSDRQAADAVRGRIDWKYALCLELEDAGFNYSVLSEFRDRLVAGGAEELILGRMLEHFKARGLVKAGGRARTDSTHVLAVIEALNRLELVGRTLQAVLEALATQVPDWLKDQVSADWFDRYGRRIDEYRLPKKTRERQGLAEQIGRDGHYLLQQLDRLSNQALLDSAVVQTLRQVWNQQYSVVDDHLRWRTQTELPPSAERIASPYDVEARYSKKREETWVGYKVHLTETCDTERPHLITHVETTVSTDQDVSALEPIHQALALSQLLPTEHTVDMGYASGETIRVSAQQFGVDLVCPVHLDTSWQARTPGAFDLSHFQIDWQAKHVTCPAGHTSRAWSTNKSLHGKPVVWARFSPTDCDPCPVRAQCTKSTTGGRDLSFLPQADFLALQAARLRQQTDDFARRYAVRAGIEGTLSQAVDPLALRRTRYIGLAKTHLQHILTAAALNLWRVVNWLNAIPRAKTRRSHFAALAA
jgi:transposase